MQDVILKVTEGAKELADGASVLIRLVNRLIIEREKRLIGFVADANEVSQVAAEACLSSLLRERIGREIVTAMVKECLFGNDNLVLASLAILSADIKNEAADVFPFRAIRALEGFSDDDILLFLRVLSACTHCKVIIEPDRGEGVVYLVPGTQLLESISSAAAMVCANDIRHLAERAIARGMILRDPAGARLSGTGPFAFIFSVSQDTRKYYELFYRAARIAESIQFTALALEAPDKLFVSGVFRNS